MQYIAEVKRYDPDDEAEATFETRKEAAEWLNEQRRYFGWGCAMWLNNERMKFHGEHLVNDEPFDPYSIAEDDKPFRPQPTRGSAPQNPATLVAKGDSV